MQVVDANNRFIGYVVGIQDAYSPPSYAFVGAVVSTIVTNNLAQLPNAAVRFSVFWGDCTQQVLYFQQRVPWILKIVTNIVKIYLDIIRILRYM